MKEATDKDSFEKIVECAYSTLPQKIRDLPDFPGIQVADEPPKEMFERMAKRRNWPRGTELLGCYSGVPRTGRRHNLVQTAPDLIFVFRGPILRRSKGDLPAEVKEVVWHEVAHWLGHDEEQVKELGLSALSRRVGGEARNAVLPERIGDTTEDAEEAEEQPLRCLKCYSADVGCRELNRPMTPSGAWLSDPVFVRTKICTCKSCGYEWDDDDNS
ncbi:MAG: metallopeptidase family protein [Terriglobales bacterium]